MRDPDNIRAAMQLGLDYIGLIFWPKSSRYVKDISTNAGTIPNMPQRLFDDGTAGKRPAIVGVFVNEMPQTLITHACQYRLDYIQLHGNETPIYIDNLRSTLVPDILPDVKIIKAISIHEADDVKRWREYEGHVDMLLFDTKCESVGGSGQQFDWTVLNDYDGNIPFLLSGGIGADDAARVREFHHPMCVGIDLNSRFETAPALKDISRLRTFIETVRG